MTSMQVWVNVTFYLLIICALDPTLALWKRRVIDFSTCMGWKTAPLTSREWLCRTLGPLAVWTWGHGFQGVLEEMIPHRVWKDKFARRKRTREPEASWNTQATPCTSETRKDRGWSSEARGHAVMPGPSTTGHSAHSTDPADATLLLKMRIWNN